MRILLALGLLLGCLTAASGQTFKPGDSIRIEIFQDPKLDRTVLVAPDGTIAFPLAGTIRAAGSTPSAIENTIRQRLQKNYTDRLDIYVALVSKAVDDPDQKPRIYMTGEISKPGPYILSKQINVVQAIAQAGGFSPFAAKHRIQVRRKIDGVEAIHYFDFSSFENGTNLTGNINLQGGDVIIVPERGLFN